MPKVYLVGVTEDRSGLVLGKSRRSKKGEAVLEVDHDVLDAIAEIRRYRVEGTARPSVSSPALPSRRTTAGEVSTPSALSPREIQARLRRGESIQSVARRAGVEEWRIEVYAAPIAAEQARVVARARELTMDKRSAGPSGRSLGESVQGNIVEKRVPMDVDSFESAWSAYEPDPDRWILRFQYVSRGHTQMAEWHYNPESEAVTALNRLATLIGWRDPRRTGKIPALPDAPGPGAPTARRRKPVRKPPAASAAKKPAARKPAARKPAARKPAPRKPAAKKPAARKPAARKPAPRKPAARKPAAKKPAAKKPAGKPSSTRSSTKPAAARTQAAKSASSRGRGRHLRIVEAPPDVVESAPTAAQAPAREPWREQLEKQAPDDISAPYTRRHWREEVGRPRDEGLDTPAWVRSGTGRAPAPVERPEPSAPAPSAVEDAPLRRASRRRQRPLRAR